MEAVKAYDGIRGHMANEITLKQGPLLAIAEGLTMLGWRMQGPVIIEDHKGMTMDLTMGSPAMLFKFMVDAYNNKK